MRLRTYECLRREELFTQLYTIWGVYLLWVKVKSHIERLLSSLDFNMQWKERLGVLFIVEQQGENMENTIVAIATATGESGIGIVRLSGEKSIDM